MTQALEILFWSGGFVAVYSYLLYPIVLQRRAAATPDDSVSTPALTVIITARNEQKRWDFLRGVRIVTWTPSQR